MMAGQGPPSRPRTLLAANLSHGGRVGRHFLRAEGAAARTGDATTESWDCDAPGTYRALPPVMTTQPLPPDPADSLTAHVCREHGCIEALLRDVCTDVDAGRMEAARTTCEAFDRRLVRHNRLEEHLLFPLFEARVGIVGGPTATLRQEHREIERTVSLMRDALDHDDADAFRDGLRFLRSTLSQHHSKEEHVLLPTTDAALSESERAAAMERLQRDPWEPSGADRYPSE
jgi:hemerythrin superfamily protein